MNTPEKNYPEIDICGTDTDGNIHRWTGFDKTDGTFQGSRENISKLEPPASQDTQERI